MKTATGLIAAAVVLAAAYAGLPWWRSNTVAHQGQQMAALAGPGDIQMLSSQTCGYCTTARQWMSEHRVAFKECFVESDGTCAELYRATMAQGTPTMLVRGQVQLGFSPAQVLQRLQQPGR